MNLIGIESVIYGVEDMPLCTQFWLDFGLILEKDTTDHVVFTTEEKTTIELKPKDASDLPKAMIEGSTVRETVWAADTQATVDQIVAELSKDRKVQIDDDGTAHSFDPLGYGIAFRATKQQPIKLAETEYNAPGQPNRIDLRGKIYKKAAPQHLAHVVFLTPEVEELPNFYISRLGFVETDRYPGRGKFLRCGGASDHHNLFLLNHGGTVGFHHVAFGVRDFHEVFGGGCFMDSQGWETHLGPGRHPISSAYFWYFRNPCGGAAEYDFDTDVLTEDWEVRDHESTPESFAEWALESGITKYKGMQSASSSEEPR